MALFYLRQLTDPTRTDSANRHLSRYLAFIAGAANAGGFLAVHQYTSHMSGIVSAAADNLAAGKLRLMLDGLAAVLAFAVGARCERQFFLLGANTPKSPCDVVRVALADAGVPYSIQDASTSNAIEVRIGTFLLSLSPDETSPDWRKATTSIIVDEIHRAGYPARADETRVSRTLALLILTMMVALVALAYGPLAAMLVELFPLRLRYTSLSFSYNLAVGWIGGLLPSVAYAIVLSTGKMFAGLMYPITITALAFFAGLIFIKDRRNSDLSA